MRIGILGGSFDPPHSGHLQMARACQEFLKLDKVIFTPAASQWQKEHHSPADVRAHMTQLAISNHPNWTISFADIERGNPTYSFQTIADFRKTYPDSELFFILGSDAANNLDTWKEPETLKSEIKFAVVKRFGIEVSIPQGFDYVEVPGEIPDISSTRIRAIVKDSKQIEKDLRNSVPIEVAKYIATVGLYQ